MIKPERKYAFRKFLAEVHRPHRCNPQRPPQPGEIVIDATWSITLPAEADDLLQTAARDLQNYFDVSMELSLPLKSGEPTLHTIYLGTPLPQGKARGFSFSATPEQIRIIGNDSPGTLQGGFFLEDLLNLREGPYLLPREERREPLFSPRMVHSGWGLDQYPDSQLQAIAHAGFDAILLFVKGVDLTTHGVMDFNDLIFRASKYALNVYFYSYLPSFKHPQDPDADQFFDASYGQVFKNCPGAKGLILVGEKAQFPSRDPRCSGQKVNRTNSDTAGIADPRPCAGFWPSNDYPQWLEAVKKAVHRYQPQADIVFWTYNWGKAPEEARVNMIRHLPADITLQATFEMFEVLTRYPHHTMVQPDYSITFPGPGRYFISEAQAAHDNKIKLYAMTNTAGMTWDFGVAPYVPAPQQWQKRFRAVVEAQQQWGLSGLMESHHYGWYPSIIAELAKWSFWSPPTDIDTIFRQILQRDFGQAAVEHAQAAYQKWSEAMNSYTPGFDDQAGPLRCGPAYPFIFHPVLYPHTEQKMIFPTTLQSTVGASWINTFYFPEAVYKQSWCGRRIPEDIKIMSKTLTLWEAGCQFMEQALKLVPEKKLPLARRAAGVGNFCYHTFQTMLNTKKWWLLNKKLEIEYEEITARQLLDQLEEIIISERRNVQETIPWVAADSRLGWEPSMDYLCDVEHLNWKLRQLDNLQHNTLRIYRQSISPRPQMS